MPTSFRRVAGPVAALLAFAELTLVATWPLGAHLGTQLADVQTTCRFDAIYSMWTLAWESHALATAPSRLLDANIYHPAANALLYGPTGIGALPIFAPVFLATGNPVLALNALLLGGVALTAWSIHLVVVHWTRQWLAGFVAGACFLATRWVLWFWTPTAPHHAVLWWMPFIVLLAATPARSFRAVLPLLVLVVLQAAVDVIYVAPAVMLPLGALALLRLVRPETRAAGARLVGVLALAMLALAPLYAGLLHVRFTNPDLAQQTMWRDSVWPRMFVPWSYLSARYPTAVPLAALAVIAVGAWLHWRRQADRTTTLPPAAWRHAAFWSAAGLAMALSPLVGWGERTFTLPHAALPLYEVIRLPARLGIAALIGLCLLTGLGFAECVHGVTVPAARRLRALALAIAILTGTWAEYRRGLAAFDRAALPPTYPIHQSPAPDPSVAELLRAGTGPVLELPAAGVLPQRHARAMYRSIAHWRPILNGYGSYWPAGFKERMELAKQLPDAAALAALRRETGVTTLVVHVGEIPDPMRTVWRDLAATGRADVRLIADVDGVLIFSVAPGA